RQTKRTHSGEETLLEQLEDPNSDPNRHWDSEHDEFVLREALKIMEEQLPELEREVLRLSLLEGRPAREVALVVGVPLGEVYKARKRGLQALRELLADFIDE